MRVVAQLLVNDATALYDDWAVKYNEGGSYADFFKNQDALTSVEQLIDGCVDIANEVGTAKIGDPYDLFKVCHNFYPFTGSPSQAASRPALPKGELLTKPQTL
jgi:hypothetical protein